MEDFQDKNNLQRKQSETSGRAAVPEQISARFPQKADQIGNLQMEEEEEGAELNGSSQLSHSLYLLLAYPHTNYSLPFP